ncbi:MAG: GNAT family N-acetyltransferase [Candidatus Solibacter sp.]
MADVVIEEWRPGQPGSPQLESDLDDLGGILHAVVQGGASVGFVLPFSPAEARSYWTAKVLRSVRNGSRRMLVARVGEEVIGTVHLNLDTMPNQSHRAEVSKLLVHPKARRQGVARAMMRELEAMARELGRTLLTLDTRSGDSAEPLYLSMGYVLAGAVPRYAQAPGGAEYEATSILYKLL